MIVIVADTAEEHEAMTRLVAGIRHRGDDEVRDLLADVRHAFIGRHPSSTVVDLVGSPDGTMQSELMTRAQTARRLGYSTTTVDRLAAAGSIEKRNGRITTASIDSYLAGDR